MMKRGSSDEREKLLGLELLRFVLALGIVVYHYFYYGPYAGAIPAEPVAPHAASVLRFAVQAFFVVSGFVIVASAQHRSALAFIKARIVRLAPAILVCSTLTFVLTNAFPDALGPPTLRSYLGCVLTIPMLYDFGYVDGSYWSLVVELRFYALVALLLLWPRTLTWIMELSLAWLAVSALLPVLFSAGVPQIGRLSSILISGYSAFFVMGICLFRMHAAPRDRPWLPRCVALGAIALGAQQVYVDYARIDMFDGTRSAWWVSLLISAGVFLLVGAAVFTPVRSAWGQLAPLAKRLGAVSFPLYLLHQRLGFWLIDHTRSWWPEGAAAAGPVLAMLASLSAAFLVSTFIEPGLRERLRQLLRGLAPARPVSGY